MQLADEENAPELTELEKLGDLLNHAQNDLRTALWGMREEIAVIVGISAETVKTHAKSVMRKLDAVNNVSAVARAYELGILRA